jgi:hypothetical protein
MKPFAANGHVADGLPLSTLPQKRSRLPSSRLPAALLLAALLMAIALVPGAPRAYAYAVADQPIATASHDRLHAGRSIDARAAISNTILSRLMRVCGISDAEIKAGRCLPEPPPRPTNLNGVRFDQIVVMSDTVKQNIRSIYARGLALGNNAHAFSKIGDSTIDSPYFLASFDGDKYNLGAYASLQFAVKHFAGSFGRKSAAVKVSMHAWTVMNPMWADKTRCDPNETPVACELRLNKPSIVFVRLGANDAGTARLFEQKMREVLDYIIGQGVIPILSTKPDVRQKAQDLNGVMRRLAAEYNIPLWDFDRLGSTMPGQGLGPDGVHLTSFPPHDYAKADAFKRGLSVQDLSALIALDAVWRAAASQ